MVPKSPLRFQHVLYDRRGCLNFALLDSRGLVHPLNEKPKRQWQCARHWCHDDKDPWFDKGGLLEDEINPHR
jgi:hypothetical protein